MQSPQQKISAASARARSASMNLTNIANELDKIATTLPTTKDQSLFKATTISKPLRYVKSQSQPLPKLTKKEKQIELNSITVESLNISSKQVEKDPKRVQVTITLGQILQCLLWDYDFRFTLLPHQIEAVFAASGIKVSPLLDKMIKLDKKELSRLIVVDARKQDGMMARRKFCKENVDFTKNRGMILADVMGLGKTVESLAATVLRNEILSMILENVEDSKKESTDRPTLIIGPDDAVITQWEDNLIMSGIDRDRIKHFRRKDKKLLAHEENFILMTRNSLMVEVRNLLSGENSVLFPLLPQLTVFQLHHLMVGSQKSMGDVQKSELITKVLCANVPLVKFRSFRTVIIDEAHMMKNLATFWSVGVGLLASVSQRSIPLSGTPIIHGPQDMATLMVFVDPSMASATKIWWRAATNTYPIEETRKNVKDWRLNYFVRREKSLLSKELPLKVVASKNISYFGSELGIYKEHETSFFDALTAFAKLDKQHEDKRELVNFLFAQITCMRMSLIHPLITKGREFTIKFSPSRRKMVNKFSNGTKICICCKMGVTSAIGTDGTKSKLVVVPPNICHAAQTQCPHYTHDSCLALLQSEVQNSCPRCKEFQNLAHIDSSVGYKIPNRIYSDTIYASTTVRGFKATSKIEQVVQWFGNVPQEDKVIIYSFFEGSLDLLEGIFVENLNIDCARFDDDVDAPTQAIELSRFKNSPTCRILLATVQSSGTGLNIDEANHVAFLDRCFNTAIHRQAEDRSHNLRQKKEVEITYFDGSMTIDEITKTMNSRSLSNDTVTIADGSSIGKKEQTIKYDDLAGSIKRMMTAVSGERQVQLTDHPENALEPSKIDLVKLIEEKENAPKAQASYTTPIVPRSILSESSKKAVLIPSNISPNASRRVSFHHATDQSSLPVTPKATIPTFSFPTPYTHNYLTAIQSPMAPSFNYSSYHGYGLTTPMNKVMAGRALFNYPLPQGIPNGSIPMHPLPQRIPNASIPVYNNMPYFPHAQPLSNQSVSSNDRKSTVSEKDHVDTDRSIKRSRNMGI